MPDSLLASPVHRSLTASEREIFGFAMSLTRNAAHTGSNAAPSEVYTPTEAPQANGAFLNTLP
jgi:hypothetical protein